MWQHDGGDRVVVVVEQAEDINCSNAGRATAIHYDVDIVRLLLGKVRCCLLLICGTVSQQLEIKYDVEDDEQDEAGEAVKH